MACLFNFNEIILNFIFLHPCLSYINHWILTTKIVILKQSLAQVVFSYLGQQAYVQGFSYPHILWLKCLMDLKLY
jgi:hypothetical protein